MKSDQRAVPGDVDPVHLPEGHPPLRRMDMVVLDLWDRVGTTDGGPGALPLSDGRRERLAEVACALHRAWLEPLGVSARAPIAAPDEPGAALLVLRHDRAGRVFARMPVQDLGRLVRLVTPTEMWVLAPPGEHGYARLWDELAGFRDGLAALCGHFPWPGPELLDEVPFQPAAPDGIAPELRVVCCPAAR